MKNAFLITAHKNFEQLRRLVGFLASGEDHVFIHIDKRSEELYQQMRAQFSENKNVHFTSCRYAVYWGSYNQIRATAALINASASFGFFDYVHLISGQDLPIMNKYEMAEFLTEKRGKEFIECLPLPVSKWNRNGGLERVELFWFDGLFSRFTYRTHLLQKALNWKRGHGKYKFYGGTNWFSLTGECIKWISDYFSVHPHYLRRFRFTRNADEIVIQTLLMISPFAKNLISDDIRYINWSDGPEFPRTLRSEDFGKIFGTKDKLFARKFDETVDNEIIERIFAELEQRKSVVV